MFDVNAVNTTCISCFKQHKVSTNPCPDCGYNEFSADLSPHLLRPRTILGGKYLVGKVIGQGGFGITYVGWDLNLGLRIALKEYYPSGFVTRETTSTSSATVQPFTGSEGEFFLKGRDKFINEARSLAKFFALPGIVSVKDYFLENGTAYITMEFIDGQTLKDYVANMGGKLIAAQVFDLMKPVMASLSEVHKAGIIHRDISPDNIMISKDGYLKLLDFGAARDFTQAGAKSMSVMLKPGFAPEEQYRTKGEQGPWTDIYALCATMYRCITGITPDESVERVRRDTVMPPSAIGINIDPRNESALMMGMAVLQGKRFQSIPAIYAAMYGVPIPNSSTPAPAPQQPSPQQPAMQGARAPVPPPQYSAPPVPQQARTPAPPPHYGAPTPPQVAMPQYRAPQGAMAPPPPPQVAMPPGRPSAPGIMPPGPMGPPPPQRSGNWISNNKAIAGVLGGVIALVLVLGIVLLVIFLPGGNNARISNTPTPGRTDTMTQSPTPTPTPTPPLAVGLGDTTWDLHEVYADGVTLNKDYLNSVGLFITFWFHANGDFTGMYDDEYGYGSWVISGDEITVNVDGERQILFLQPDGNSFIWIEGEVGTMTFVRNDYVSFMPPGGGIIQTTPTAPISQDYHFAKGFWYIQRADSYQHFIAANPYLIFFGNSDLYASPGYHSTDGDWATWYIVNENEIIITDYWGTSETFTISISSDILTIIDSAGGKSEYERISHDHPYGNWVFHSGDWIWIFGLSDSVYFNVDGYAYASESGNNLSWWFDPDYDGVIGILDTSSYEQRYFTFRTEDGYLTIWDEDGDWIRLERYWW